LLDTRSVMALAQHGGSGDRVTPHRRPDLDMLLHIELVPDVASEAAHQLEALGYRLEPPFGRKGPACRFRRRNDTVDVMSPDHPAPIRRQRLQRSRMFEVVGGKQPLMRTMLLVFDTGDDVIELSVPDELGALVLKAAGHMNDSRHGERHLTDAATLAARITNHASELARLKGSDGKRLRHLAGALANPRHRAWLLRPDPHRTAGQDTLRILSADRATPRRT
jgi:hypothetical protein